MIDDHWRRGTESDKFETVTAVRYPGVPRPSSDKEGARTAGGRWDDLLGDMWDNLWDNLSQVGRMIWNSSRVAQPCGTTSGRQRPSLPQNLCLP